MSQELFWNYCKFNSSTSGTGSFTVGSVFADDVAGSHAVPENAGVIDGSSYRYYAQNADGSQWEWGRGVYATATDTLTRATVVRNSEGTLVPLNFTTNPIVDVIPKPQKTVESPGFPSGTVLPFFQAAAPVGWTKLTSQNDKAIRVVSGTGGGTGGTSAFTTVFGKTTTDTHALSTAELAAHAHTTTISINLSGAGGGSAVIPGNSQPESSTGFGSANTGSGTAHNHPMDIRVQYIDMILCSKD